MLPVRPQHRPLVMGVVNVTPDSFSDGGRWFSADRAIAHGEQLIADGADMLDIGGESTRPGAERPSVQEELDRVIPVTSALAGQGAIVSVDTMRAEVAARALEAGAAIINDVSGGLADPAMAPLVAASGAPYVAMHWRGHSQDMQTRAHYDDVVADVCRELQQRVEVLVSAGARREQLVLDPGLGFAKTAEQNWECLRGLPAMSSLGLPLLVGASRKSFVGTVGMPPGQVAPPDRRDAATAAISVVLAQADVWAIRVHEVRSTMAALDVVQHMRGQL